MGEHSISKAYLRCIGSPYLYFLSGYRRVSNLHFPLDHFFIHFVGSESWLRSIVGAILTSILSYLLFDTWLQANLPRGISGF